MADISRLVLKSIHNVTVLVENDVMPLNQNQCRHLAVCLKQVKDSLFSKPVRIYRQLLERVRRTVKKVESFVVKCNNKDWLVTALSIGVSEEETKDLVLELRWCLETQFNHSQGPLATLPGQGQIWVPPHMMLPSEEDICKDKKCLIDKLQVFLSRTSEENEKRDLAMYLQGRLKILEEESRSMKPSLEHILWRKKLPELSKHEHLGKGSFALVFKASWLGVPCAKKCLTRVGGNFGREAGTLAMLNHPNIVRLYCCHEDKKSQSLVMELMDGSLYDLLDESRSRSPFDLETAVEILLQIVKGVLYLHENGFAHRDLKSHNILLTKSKDSQTRTSAGDFVVKVADFGLVKLFDPTDSNLMTLTTTKVGSGAWRAPEVLLNNNTKISPRRSDIYSFAMVCYEILSGEIPFKRFGLSNEELFNKIVHSGLRPLLPKDCPDTRRKLVVFHYWE